jgi:ferric-dicitrate binding protein FerR (iron transport regulator)
MSDHAPPTDAADEDRTMRLLRLAGPRPSVPDVRTVRVRATVHTRWRTASRRRAIRRRVVAATVLLAVAAVLVVAIRVRQPGMPIDTHDSVAVVERIDGTPRRVTNDASAGARALSIGDAVRTGEWIETDEGSRASIRFPDGTSVRLDMGSRARPLSPGIIELSSGAVYVDTDRAAGRFEVRTAVATAHDVGTQFEVRVVDRTLRLRVRTGVVELRDGTRSVSGRAGTEVTFSAAGAVSRPIAPHGPAWNWIDSLAPRLEIEGLTLSAFLERMAREHGWDLRYADAGLARDASAIVLHGSVDGLPPREALEVAITTSGLQHRLENGTLTVFRGSAVKKPL